MITDPISDKKLLGHGRGRRRALRGSSSWTAILVIQLYYGHAHRRNSPGRPQARQAEVGLRLSQTLPPTSGAALHRKEVTRGGTCDDHRSHLG